MNVFFKSTNGIWHLLERGYYRCNKAVGLHPVKGRVKVNLVAPLFPICKNCEGFI